jgi:hypothetical protein
MNKTEAQRWIIITLIVATASAALIYYSWTRSQKNQIQAQEAQISLNKDKFDSLDTVKAIEAGKSCYKGKHGTWSCIYKVGEELNFKISFTGIAHKVAIKKSGTKNGDFYIPFDSAIWKIVGPFKRTGFVIEFDCIPVSAGAKTLGIDNPVYFGVTSPAYISPADGRVFPEKELCEDMTMFFFGVGRK